MNICHSTSTHSLHYIYSLITLHLHTPLTNLTLHLHFPYTNLTIPMPVKEKFGMSVTVTEWASAARPRLPSHKDCKVYGVGDMCVCVTQRLQQCIVLQRGTLLAYPPLNTWTVLSKGNGEGGGVYGRLAATGDQVDRYPVHFNQVRCHAHCPLFPLFVLFICVYEGTS